MSLDVVIGLLGVIVTVLVVVGMILITPRGVVDLRAQATDSQSPDVRQAEAPEGSSRVPARP